MTSKPYQPAPENRVAPRVRILPLHDISFIADESSRDLWGPSPVRVNNISTSGVGFILGGDEEVPSLKEGDNFSGTFHVATKMTPLKLEVVHVSPKIMGCRFVEPPKDFSQLITQYFDLEISALTMVKVNPAMLKKVDDGEPHWFKGGSDCEFYYVQKEDQLQRFRLSFLGNHLEYDPESGLRYGTVVDEASSGTIYKGSSLVRWQETVPSDFFNMAEKFVENIKELPKKITHSVLANFKSQKK